MSLEENKALVRRVVEALWNEGNTAIVDEVFTPQFVNHTASPGSAADRAGFKESARTIRRIFPDFRVTIDSVIAEADDVVVLFTAHGTQGGVWDHPIIGRIGPQAQQATWGGVRIFHLAGGQITETWVYSDSLAMLQQLGALSTVTQAAR